MHTRLALVIILFALCGAHGASRYYVATNGNSNAGDRWSTAFTNIQDALDVAVDGDTVYLAGHAFTLTNEIVWTSSYVTVMGGYAATNDADAPGPFDARLWPTVIRGGTNPVTTYNRVMTITNVTGGRLERVTLTGGRAPAATVANAAVYGGGLWLTRCGGITLADCTVSNNAIRVGALNQNSYGGGIAAVDSVVAVSNCVVRDNQAQGYRASGSYTYARGGGVMLIRGEMKIRDTVVAYNRVASGATWLYGAGLDNASGKLALRNCLIHGNSGTTGSAGLYLQGDTLLEHCTVVHNAKTGLARNSGTVTVTNSVFFGNLGDISGTVALRFSSTEDGVNEGNDGCIRADPLFERGYYLAPGSPCVDAGAGTAADWGLDALTTRADGVPDSGAADMGYHHAAGLVFDAADLYVAPDGDDANGGGSPEQAFRTITKALAVARDGDQIHVAAGDYTRASGEVFPLTLAGRTGVWLLGTNRAATVIDARAASASEDQRVMTIQGAQDIRVEGMTLTGGREPPVTVADSTGYGGGVLLSGSIGIAFADCVVSNNAIRAGSLKQNGHGGGIAAVDSVAAISNCLVRDNQAQGNWSGGGSTRGGGVCVLQGAMTIRDSVIAFNLALNGTSFQYGGGVYSSGSLVMRNCLVYGNDKTTSLGAGGGLCVGGNTRVEHCTVANNIGAGLYREGGAVTVRNSIFWGNMGDIGGTVTLGWSNTEDGLNAGNDGCISADPLFERAFYLAPASPCVNAGTNAAADWGLENRTTRTDGANDAGTADMGYHYAGGFDFDGADLYVAPDGDDANGGTAPEQALRTLTKALAATREGGRIHVAAGPYTKESGESFPLTISRMADVRILGTNRAATVIDAGGVGVATGRVVTIAWGGGTRIEGVTLRGGYYAPKSWATFVGGGAAISRSGVVELFDCLITSNTLGATGHGAGYGGGVYAADSRVTIRNCAVTHNTAFGSGVYHCLGGGAYAATSRVKIFESVFAGNKVKEVQVGTGGEQGGAVYSEGTGATLLMRNVLVYTNRAEGGNASGHGLYLANNASLENCTVACNAGEGVRQTGGTVTLANCIVWGNSTNVIGTVAATYSDIGTEGDPVGEGCINADPLFKAAADFRLCSGSLCINTGTNLAWTTDAFDLAGSPRINGRAVDMGAYESFTSAGTLLLLR